MPEPPPGVPRPPATTQEETGPIFLDEEPADEPTDEPRPADSALPELRPRGEVGVRPDEPVTDWDDPSRLHGNRPEPATAWKADASRQAGFDGEQDRKVAWGTDEDYSTSPVLGAGRTPRAIGQGSADPRGGRQRPAEPDAAESEGRDKGEEKSERQDGKGAEKQGEKEPAQPVREETTRLRRADILAARAAHRAAQQAARPSPPPAPSSPAPSSPALAAPAAPAPSGWAQQVHELAHQIPTQSAQPAVPAQAQGPGPAPAAAASTPEAGPVTPWKPPVNDPFLQAAQAQARPAGLGRRFVARLLDGIVVAAVGGAVALPLLPKATDHIQAKVDAAEQAGVTQEIWLVDATTGGYLAMVFATVLVFGVLYEVLPTARWGRTLGKTLCGVRVLDMAQQLPPGFGAALLRWLVQGVLSAVVVGVLNVAWCLFDRPWRQCWHDKVARTFVARG